MYSDFSQRMVQVRWVGAGRYGVFVERNGLARQREGDGTSREAARVAPHAPAMLGQHLILLGGERPGLVEHGQVLL